MLKLYVIDIIQVHQEFAVPLQGIQAQQKTDGPVLSSKQNNISFRLQILCSISYQF